MEWAVPVDVSSREGKGERLEETVVEREVAGRRGFARGELPELKEMLTGQMRRAVLTTGSWWRLMATMNGISSVSFLRPVLAFMSSSQVMDASQS